MPLIKSLDELFDTYKDPEERIGPNGVEVLCNDMQISPDSLTALVLAWQLNAAEMGYFTREEFVGGMELLKSYDLHTLRNKILKLETEVQSNTGLFTDLYKFAFGFCCDRANKKSADIDVAASMLELVLPNGPHTKRFSEFLRQTKSYKVINKDQWACFLEFSRNVKKDLSNYDNSEAWPLLIDEFVEFIRS